MVNQLHGIQTMVVNSLLDDFCDEFAIKRSFSVPYAPPQNAHAERMWGILLKGVRTCLAESNVPDRFWTYAMSHIALCHNCLPSSVLPDL